ncbi:dihydroorotase [Ophidiomyces ophidiicola]|nr:dihydroorotase [Ophidiomyces ophidiicola]KAI2003369.1 dihydroorotase [Ophidiomyces ophidiicola]
MRLKEVSRLELPPTADMHVHLRDGPMMELITPQIRRGGVDTVFVMPNLVPPVTTVAQALEYRNRLLAIDPTMTYLMLKIYSSITPEVIAEAAAAGISGVKVYPQGVTTNSASGVANLDDFFPVFEAMEKHHIVLNIHGEVPDVNVMNAEEAFLPTLKRIHEHFPNLRIILEHCSTAAAVEAVRSCGSSVAATITAHHLYLTIDDTVNPLAFCKPIAKTPQDRNALLKATCSNDSKFFFGSDSAPHPVSSKQGATPAAGVYTQSFATQYVVKALEDAVESGIVDESEVTQESLENFLSRSGRKFYKLPEENATKIVLERKGEVIPKTIKSADGNVEVALSKGGEEVFSLRWVH